MWMYSGPEDTARTHLEEVDEETVAKWLKSITGNKDNPRGSRRILPFDAQNAPGEVFTRMYSMPNREQLQEGVESDGESTDYEYTDHSEDDSEDSGSNEEVDSPPRSERRSKQLRDPAGGCGKAVPLSEKFLKRTRTSDPDPSEKAASRPKLFHRNLKRLCPGSSAATSATSMDIDEERGDAETADAATSRAALTAQAPDPIAQPQASTPLATSFVPSSLSFVVHHVPEDQVGAAKEAMIQAGLMMDRMKVVYDTSKATYDASSALQANVRKSCELGTQYADLEKEKIQLKLDLDLAKENLKKAQDEVAVIENRQLQARLRNVISLDKMKQALEQKDLDLAGAQKIACEKTKLADRKLASVGKLEEENAKLKTSLDEAKKQVMQLKEEKVALADKVDVLTRKRDELEAYLGGLAKKMFLMLEEFCQNFEEETGRIKTGLDPINSPIKDEAAMNVLRLESRLASVLDYVAQLKVALTRIDKELWPKDVLLNDLESLMTRLNDIPDRVQAWKKSTAHCGADVDLSLVRFHCKDAKEEKLKALQVANTKKLQFQSSMETFIDAATRIADGIDLDTFIEPASPPPAE
ncbi:hypothetical protein VPH35_137474 [Triticum aestivum]